MVLTDLVAGEECVRVQRGSNRHQSLHFDYFDFEVGISQMSSRDVFEQQRENGVAK